MSAAAPDRLPALRSAGMTQNDRLRPALAPRYFALEERSAAQRMALARKYARLLQYVDVQGNDAGDWSPFLASDRSFLLAEIATIGPAAIGSIGDLHGVVRLLDGWYRELARDEAQALTSDVQPVFADLTEQVTSRLGPTLAGLMAQPAFAQQWQQLDAGAGPLSAIWTSAKVGNAAPTLVAAGAQFLQAVRQLARTAQHCLAVSLTESGHPPHSGLYLAFLGLLETAQHDLNRFTQRYLNYYYRELLGFMPQGAVADDAVVTVGLSATVPSYTVPAGFQFSAGQDAQGKTIVYAADTDTFLSHASVAATSTLMLARGGDGMVSAAYAAPAAASADGLGQPLADPQQGWPTFGAASAGAPLDAALGLLVSSPLLALSGGTRTVTVTLQFGANCAQLTADYLQTTGATLTGAFVLSLSGAAGWFAPATFSLAQGSDNSAWTLSFTLQPADPAIVANAVLAPAGADPWPLLRLCLNPAATPYAYSYFAALQLAGMTVSVSVLGLGSLQLSTSAGPVKPGAPFAPFGMAPMPGQYLCVAHPELAAKPVTSATVHLAWSNLPLAIATTGTAAATFTDYYAGYQPYVYTNAVFTAAPAVYSAGQWTSVGAALALFDTTLAATTSYTFDLSALPWTWSDAQASAGTATARATLQLALAAPAYGFGSGIYPTLFANAAIAQAKSMMPAPQPGPIDRTIAWIKCKLFKDCPPAPAPVVLPNVPFVPMASAATLDYNAVGAVALAAPAGMPPQCWQLGPFGIRPAAVGSTLYPVESDDGHLYIALAGAPAGQELSLHVQMRGIPGSSVTLENGTGGAAQAVRWRYLAGSTWTDFPPGSITSATSDFTGSGIVRLAVPSVLASDTAWMAACGADGAFWIEARVARQPESYPPTVAILPQALTVQRLLSDGATDVPHPLPAGSIAALVAPVAALKSITQPYPSTGGAPAETEDWFHARVSERLRHKDRASQLRDYEQLLLAALPGLWQVKCIGPNNSGSFDAAWQVAPGHVVLAVTADGSATPQLAAPFTEADLYGIAAQARALSSAAIASITVRNLCYEVLTVDVTVQFVAGADAAACNQQLNSTLCDFLAPPGPYPGALPIGCGSVDVDQVLALVRSQSYVAQVGSLSLTQALCPAGAGPQDALVLSPGQSAVSRTPWSVLVSAARHTISPLSQAPSPTPAPSAAPAAASSSAPYELTLPLAQLMEPS
ncbi:MAG TPA: baseplate J/gp47 family protein [Telluria sp.]|nr:baseplate J/gp47 family protein [Telluria sp.]